MVNRSAASAGYVFYFIHVVLVFYGIACFPYTKLAHLLYRGLAVMYADYEVQAAGSAGGERSWNGAA